MSLYVCQYLTVLVNEDNLICAWHMEDNNIHDALNPTKAATFHTMVAYSLRVVHFMWECGVIFLLHEICSLLRYK